MADFDSKTTGSLVGGGLRREIVLTMAAQVDDVNDFAFPENLSMPKEWCSYRNGSGRKREMDVSSVLLLQGSHSHAKSLNDLLVVATQARLDPRPSRSHSGTTRDPGTTKDPGTTRDPGTQDPKHTATA